MRLIHYRPGHVLLRPVIYTCVSLLTSTLFSHAHAQTPSASAQAESQRWRNANSDVGRYTRGHIDLLKAERGHTAGKSGPRKFGQVDKR